MMIVSSKGPILGIINYSILFNAPLSTFSFQTKILISVLIFFSCKHMLWVLIRSSLHLRGASNEYPQYIFSWRNKKNIIWIPILYRAMTSVLSGYRITVYYWAYRRTKHVRRGPLCWPNIFCGLELHQNSEPGYAGIKLPPRTPTHYFFLLTVPSFII